MLESEEKKTQGQKAEKKIHGCFTNRSNFMRDIAVEYVMSPIPE